MAGRVDWQKPKKLANIFTTGTDFSRHCASSFDLNSFSSFKIGFISMEFHEEPQVFCLLFGI